MPCIETLAAVFGHTTIRLPRLPFSPDIPKAQSDRILINSEWSVFCDRQKLEICIRVGIVRSVWQFDSWSSNSVVV